GFETPGGHCASGHCASVAPGSALRWPDRIRSGAVHPDNGSAHFFVTVEGFHPGQCLVPSPQLRTVAVIDLDGNWAIAEGPRDDLRRLLGAVVLPRRGVMVIPNPPLAHDLECIALLRGHVVGCPGVAELVEHHSFFATVRLAGADVDDAEAALLGVQSFLPSAAERRVVVAENQLW